MEGTFFLKIGGDLVDADFIKSFLPPDDYEKISMFCEGYLQGKEKYGKKKNEQEKR